MELARRSYWSRVSFNAVTGVSVRWKNMDRGTQGEHNVKMKPESGLCIYIQRLSQMSESHRKNQGTWISLPSDTCILDFKCLEL